ncbi:MAG: 4Fe-4S binding protein [Proteobacteria bacterium]|nr:4Fe-4S binding protein [Pseudomonadota bacterium]MBU1687043.1 4Fe-4S binding protein [Pseudomonadota bacterium]
MDSRMYVLKFPKATIDQPIICNLMKLYGVEFNILKADINRQQEGLMVLELLGHKAKLKEGIRYLKELGVGVERVASRIGRNDDKCFQCGACTGICPTGALALERPTMAVLFDREKCSGCGLCVAVCPVRAMTVTLDHSAL